MVGNAQGGRKAAPGSKIEQSGNRETKRLQRKTVRRLSKTNEMESVRREAKEAAKDAALQASLAFLQGRESDDISAMDSFSEVSTELAVRRGSQRGQVEHNERSGTPDEDLHPSDYELTTVTEDTTKSSRLRVILFWKGGKSPPSPAKGKGKRKKKFQTLSRDIGNDAWMCGVCGKAFASLESAEKHEGEHIRKVVNDFGWIAGSTPSPTGASSSCLATPSNQPLAQNCNKNKNSNHIQENKCKPATGNSPGNLSSSNLSSPMGNTINFALKAKQHLMLSKPQPPPRVNMTTKPRVRFDDQSPQPSTNKAPATGMARDEGTPMPGLPEDSMVPSLLVRPGLHRSTSSNAMRPVKEDHMGNEEDLLLTSSLRQYVVLADEALLNVCYHAVPLILTQEESQAERELEWLAKDKSYYDLIGQRMAARKANPSDRFRAEGKTVWSKVQNKFIDAYQLMKEGGELKGSGGLKDQYTIRKNKGTDGDHVHYLEHTQKTLYVNVMVKNSIQVVKHELERLAKKRWENSVAYPEGEDKANRFERFRALAHLNLVKLAGIALASDFTPRRIAVQLSNDLYRMLTPRLKRRGVTIETEIEYRVGPYFVLAVNIKTIDWGRLIKAASRDVAERKKRWREQAKDEDDPGEDNGNSKQNQNKMVAAVRRWFTPVLQVCHLTKAEILYYLLACLYHVHWIIYVPICFVSYHTFWGPLIRRVIITSVTDEIFYYVEQKGMEMDLEFRSASTQAAFMLSALREIRADGRELKQKQEETKSADKGVILGPLLGPLIKSDKGPAASPPPSFEMPENLEFVGLELDLPVGFRRLRWAMLHSESKFTSDAVFREAAKYDNVTVGDWSRHNEHIGLPTLPDGVSEDDFVGAEQETSYLMPKSAFVKANMAYETINIIAYNDYVFAVKKKALTPEVPYGSTFVAWTQYVFINTGNDTCKMICSVEAEFPNGPPLVSRQINSGMRAGTAELFVKVGETISKYADEYP